MRNAKIVATLGPATSTPETIRALVDAGLDVARINRSHGSAAEHEAIIAHVRAAAEESGRAVAVLVDLQGPKIRLETFEEGPVLLNRGDKFTITVRDVPGTKRICGTTFKKLPGDCDPGDILLIDDGKVQIRVESVTETDVHTVVEVGGQVSDHKGINLPGVAVSVPAMSEKDKEDLRWGLEVGADFIALSFVRDAADVEDVHAIMDEVGRRVPVIAKIEKPQAVAALDRIVKAFDGIMVARGDLGVELPLEEVPLVQKRAVEAARRRAKPVIVATQVLESMTTNPRPTRAEASDCANAILDGADAVMLSGETSVGDFPVEAVATMARIIESTETRGADRIARLGSVPATRGSVITKAAVDIATMLDTKFLVTFTQSGHSARRVARLRPTIPMLAFTPDRATRNRLALVWGMQTHIVESVAHTDDMVDQVDHVLQRDGLATEGERVVIVAGMPPGVSGTTNSIRVHDIGESSRG